MILGGLKNYPKIRKIPVFLFLSVAFYLCLDFYYSLNGLKGFQTVNNGLQTCFSRVNQSFISNVFNSSKNSAHLKPEFLSRTEECFGDVLKRAEPLFARLNKEIDPKINALVSEIYWLHKDIKEKTEGEKIKKRFKKIEGINISALQELEKLDTKGMQVIEKKKIWFFLSYFGLLLSIFLDIMASAFGQPEMEIKEEIENKNTETITSMLSYPIVPAIPKPNFVNNFQSFNTIINLPASVKTDGEDKNLGESAILEDVLAKIIDFLSVPLFTKGIKLELEINEDVNVYISPEVLEQSLFSFLNFSINNFQEGSLDRKITLRTKLLGETAIFEIRNNGVSFGESFLKDSNGLYLTSEFSKRSLDLKIGTELIREYAGNVYFENTSGEPLIRVQLKSSKVKNSRVRNKLGKSNNLALSI
jgi:hypothetical protein